MHVASLFFRDGVRFRGYSPAFARRWRDSGRRAAFTYFIIDTLVVNTNVFISLGSGERSPPARFCVSVRSR